MLFRQIFRHTHLLCISLLLAACGQPALDPIPELSVQAGSVGAADIDISRSEAVFSGVRGTTSAAQKVVLKNTGDVPLVVTSALVGAHRNAFTLSASRSPLTLAPGSAETLSVRFTPGRAQVGVLRAALRLSSNDPDERRLTVRLYGLSARGEQGSNEPPLQAIVRTLGYTVNVGGRGLILGTRPAPIGAEVRVSRFQKASSGPVTLTPVARYSPDDPLPYGTYTGASRPVHKTVGTIASGFEQSLNPATEDGSRVDFEPSSSPFGFFVGSTRYAAHKTYTQDALNSGPVAHAVRVYPLRNRRGQRLANSYLLAFEPASNGDYQDYVFVVTNVKPAR
ncbi:MAG: hypothetical protein AVDCRST_MAG86-1713 [uncultured Truepera sp.]|uniref:Cep192/Spd-2-like domain-containing protein n=1 Tax=uncultured Truepera sp. TaxID=543023 RepID=A0A6J4V8X9_9DEIN|nr:MAG: hypothetical protein AVDCRST_MAG86-1713 [uncultured Truepera sp.]